MCISPVSWNWAREQGWLEKNSQCGCNLWQAPSAGVVICHLGHRPCVDSGSAATLLLAHRSQCPSWLGSQSCMPDFYRNSSVYLFPSPKTDVWRSLVPYFAPGSLVLHSLAAHILFSEDDVYVSPVALSGQCSAGSLPQLLWASLLHPFLNLISLVDEFADFCCNPGLAGFGCCFVWDVFFGCILKGSLEDVPELLCSCCVLWLYHCWTEVHFLQAGPVRQFALALTGTSYWACFFLVVLMMNSQYGMLWSERPGMTSVLGMSCGQFVKYRSRVLSSLVGSHTNWSSRGSHGEGLG